MKIIDPAAPRAERFTRRRAMGVAAGIGLGLTLGTEHLRRARPTSAQDGTPKAGEPHVIVGDVLDFILGPDGRWAGHFGSVTLKLHAGFFDGGDAWFIRTDASDLAFAQTNGLVYVPLLNNALQASESHGKLYLFETGTDGQRPVVNTVPGQTTFTPAFQVHRVTFSGEPALLDSERAIDDAVAAGTAAVDATDIVVNYPLVIWPGGGLPVDPDLVQPLGPGALIEEPDLTTGRVTFKLHQCYPGSRYIATDTSAAPMAPMMGVAASEATQGLIAIKATAPIYVFMPGLPGPAAMGSQPSVFNSKAGDVIWSPFWEHITVAWTEGTEPRVLTSEAEIQTALDAGEVALFKGVPETDPVSFVVNCPAPILAENDYDPAAFERMATPATKAPSEGRSACVAEAGARWWFGSTWTSERPESASLRCPVRQPRPHHRSRPRRTRNCPLPRRPRGRRTPRRPARGSPAREAPAAAGQPRAGGRGRPARGRPAQRLPQTNVPRRQPDAARRTRSVR